MGLSKNDSRSCCRRDLSVSRHRNAPKKRPLAAAVLERVQLLDYQAATTAPLNLVWMNSFTAGL